MTKAEKIFTSTLNECRNSIKFWGFETNPDGRPVGFETLCRNCLTGDCMIYTRTFNAIQKLIDSRCKTLSLSKKLNVLTDDEYKFEKFALDMVQVTLENHKKALKEA